MHSGRHTAKTKVTTVNFNNKISQRGEGRTTIKRERKKGRSASGAGADERVGKRATAQAAGEHGMGLPPSAQSASEQAG